MTQKRFQNMPALALFFPLETKKCLLGCNILTPIAANLFKKALVV